MNIKKVIGWVVLLLPFVGTLSFLLYQAYRDGVLLDLFIGIGIVAVIVLCIFTGIWLITDKF